MLMYTYPPWYKRNSDFESPMIGGETEKDREGKKVTNPSKAQIDLE